MNDIQNLLHNLLGNRLLINEPLDKHTTWRVGGPALFFANIKDRRELEEVVDISKTRNIPVFILGKGSNVLFSDEGFNGIVVKLLGEFEEIKFTRSELIVGGGAGLSVLSKYAIENSIAGLEFANDIPGTVGGAIRTNAGAFGKNIGELVSSVEIYDLESNNIKEIKPHFEYRACSINNKQVILKVRLKAERGNRKEILERINEYRAARKLAQPSGRSAGSVFKNPHGLSAGKLIEESGCKGLSVGDAVVSSKHANFIINKGNASSSDILQLIKTVQERVLKNSGNELETEVKLIAFGGLTG